MHCQNKFETDKMRKMFEMGLIGQAELGHKLYGVG